MHLCQDHAVGNEMQAHFQAVYIRSNPIQPFTLPFDGWMKREAVDTRLLAAMMASEDVTRNVQ